MEMNSKEYNGLCSCGKYHSVVVDTICIEKGASDKLKEDLTSGKYTEYKNPVIICDENTWQASRMYLEELIGRCERITLSPIGLHADNHGVNLVKDLWKKEYDLILAVGAGSIHDISRFIAHESGIPFLSYPTAASVDGFVSTVAAMTWNGMKTTLPAVSPIAVYADIDVFSKAPYRLTASGISDLLGKYTALADWKISHLLTGEHFCERIDTMERDAIAKVLACIDDLKEGKDAAYERLMYALLLSGLAMQMMGNSRPASGAEHHISHLWEMEVINTTLDALHGEKVSIGLLLALEKYQQYAAGIRNGAYTASAYKGMPQHITKYFTDRGILEGVRKENSPEPLDGIRAEELTEALPKVADILEELPSYEEMETILKNAGCSCAMEDIGLSKDTLPGEDFKKITLSMSPYVRNRLTMMRIGWLLEDKQGKN